MKKVKFTKEYASVEKGTEKEYPSILASKLVNVYKVAKYVSDKEDKKAPQSKKGAIETKKKK